MVSWVLGPLRKMNQSPQS